MQHGADRTRSYGTSGLRRLAAVWAGVLAAAMVIPAPASAAGTGPRVVVTIAPLHALVAMVTDGVTEPRLLLRAHHSPHGGHHTPAQAQAVHGADLVVAVARSFEAGLASATVPVLYAQDVPGVTLLPLRPAGEWELPHTPTAQPAPSMDTDPHLWLAPANARAVVRAVAETLAETDAAHATAYRENAARADAALLVLESKLRATLHAHPAAPFVVYHDAYQYLEHAFGLHGAGAVTASPEYPPSARQLRAWRARLRAGDVACVFREPSQPARSLAPLVEGTGAYVGVLDAEGAYDLPPGPALYPALMQRLAAELAACFAHAAGTANGGTAP